MDESDVLFRWSNEYDTGVRVIDGDHHDLFDAVNQLHAATNGAAGTVDAVRGEVLGFLGRYVREHFEREERLLVEYGYPKLAEHQREHARFLRFVKAARFLNANAPHLIDPRKLVSYLGLWLRHHILHADQDYVPYLTGDYGRRKSDIGAPFTEGDRFDDGATGDDAAGPRGDDGARGDKPVSVTLVVPERAVMTLRKCANALREDEDLAAKIADLVAPALDMDIEEAKRVAAPILRDDGRPRI